MTQTISDALHTATLLLARSSASARLDAELLLEYVTGLSRTDFRAAPERALPAAAGWSFQQLIRRRLQGEPVAYIRGHQEFWSLLLEVTPAVLIPRPETELVVERTLALLRPDATEMADLGTGSGAIALAVASERPSLQITAVDVSGEALEIARRNAARLQTRQRPVRARQLVRAARRPAFRCHRRESALRRARRYGPCAGRQPFRARDRADRRRHAGWKRSSRSSRRRAQHLQPGGWLVLEHGWTQAGAVRDRLVRSGFAHVRSHADLAGHERVTEGSLP